MDSDRTRKHVTVSRRKILATAASIGLTAGVAGCQGTDEDAEPTGTSPASTADTETETAATTETGGTLQRDGADAMPASPISTHPRELALEASDFGEEWEFVSSQTVLDDDIIYAAVDDGEQATSQEIRWENTTQGAESLYGPTIFTDADAAAEVITTTEQGVADSDATDYSIDIGDSSVLYTTTSDSDSDMLGVVVQERNATVGMSYYGPDDTDISEWPETVRPFMESAHRPLADAY